MGVPFYGISFTLKDQNQHRIGAPVSASGVKQHQKICTDVEKNGWKNEDIGVNRKFYNYFGKKLSLFKLFSYFIAFKIIEN
jgi:hypothetical protein